MAKDKKSFLLYTDQQGVFNQLPDEIAGKLIKHIFAYVNDENPPCDDLLLSIAFEPIKLQLKRDLKKYEEYIDKQKVNGLKGGRPKKATESQETQPFFEKPKKTDNDNVNDNDTDNDTEIKKGAKKFLPPSKDECIDFFKTNNYPISEAASFFHYWESMNWTRKGGKIQKWKSAAQQWMMKSEPEKPNQSTQPTQKRFNIADYE